MQQSLRLLRYVIVSWLCGPLTAAAVTAQDMNMDTRSHWEFESDGVVFAEINHQAGPRGGDEFVVPNCVGSRKHRAFDGVRVMDTSQRQRRRHRDNRRLWPQ